MIYSIRTNQYYKIMYIGEFYENLLIHTFGGKEFMGLMIICYNIHGIIPLFML